MGDKPGGERDSHEGDFDKVRDKVRDKVWRMEEAMNRAAIVVAVICLAATTSRAATANTPETFSGADTAGWVVYDLINENTPNSLSLDSGALRLKYGALSIIAPPDEHVIQAKAGASGGAFVGDYLAVGAQAISFRFKGDMSAGVQLLLHSDTSGRRWRFDISGLTPGGGTTCSFQSAPNF